MDLHAGPVLQSNIQEPISKVERWILHCSRGRNWGR